ncbi:MAG: flavodoxin family protein [Bacillota bacterium]
MARGLIACYSRSGYTATLAQEMASLTGWDLETISDVQPRLGSWGFLRCILDVLFGRRPGIRTTGKDPGAYDLVVLMAPVWARRLSAPMCSYIARHRTEFKALAFACTYGGRGAENAAREAAAIAGKPLRAALGVTAQEIDQMNFRAKLDAFLSKLK